MLSICPRLLLNGFVIDPVGPSVPLELSSYTVADLVIKTEDNV